VNTTVVITTLLIVVARIVDVSLDTLRTAAIVQGRRAYAACLGFVEAMVYICAIAKVLQDLSHPSYLVAYALGFALGTYLGIAIEQYLAFGKQVASLFTRKGVDLVEALVAAAIDESCFCVVNDVRVAGYVAHREISQPRGQRTQHAVKP